MKIRLNYFVYPEFQGSLLLINLVVNFFLFSYISIRVQSFFDVLVENGKSLGIPYGHTYFQFIENQRMYLRSEFNLGIMVSLLGTSLLTLWISHKLAGPLVRLKNHLVKTALEGRYKPLTFRENDYFKELPLELNKAMESVLNNESK